MAVCFAQGGGVRILLHEADPNLETEQGQRPLSLVKASYSGHELSRESTWLHVFFVSGECYIFLVYFLLGFHLQ